MPLRLDRAQLALATLAVVLFLGAIAVLVVPASPAGAAPLGAAAAAPPVRFEPPLYALANEPETALVEQNPFEPSRRPPDRRWSAAAAALEGAGGFQPQPLNPGFTLLGTVIVPGGRDIAVLRVPPLHPTGATFHVGDEPLPGWRLTRIARDRATLVGQGQRLELEIENPSPGGPL